MKKISGSHNRSGCPGRHFQWLIDLLRDLRPDLAPLFAQDDQAGLALFRWILGPGQKEFAALADAPLRELLNKSLRSLPITILEALVYHDRPDVQKAFPLPGGLNNFRQWFLAHGVGEHDLSRLLDHDLKRQYRALHPEQPEQADKATERAFGVNLILPADYLAEKQAFFQAMTEVLKSARVPFATVIQPAGENAAAPEKPYFFNIFCLSAAGIAAFYAKAGFEPFNGHCNIAYMDKPDADSGQAAFFSELIDEIWVSDSHLCDLLAPVSLAPVLTMPLAAASKGGRKGIAPRWRQRLELLHDFLRQNAGANVSPADLLAKIDIDSIKNHMAMPDQIRARPALFRLAGGAQAQLKVDHIVKTDAHLIVSGWISRQMPLGLQINGKMAACAMADFFCREDVNPHFGTPPDYRHGFSLCAAGENIQAAALLVFDGDACFHFSLPLDNAAAACEIADKPILGEKTYGRFSIDNLPALPENSAIKCAIEYAFRWPDASLGNPVLIGGCMVLPDAAETLCARPGGWRQMPFEPVFYLRPGAAADNDVFAARNRAGSGFVAVIRDFPANAGEIALIIENEGQKWLAAQRRIEDIFAYRKYLQAIFSLPFPSTQLARVYEKAFAPLLCPIQQARMAGAAVCESGAFGAPAPRPEISVIIPLYGDLDLLARQIESFAAQKEFFAKAEIIYVLDDPAIVDAFRIRMQELFERFATPVRWLAANANYGFAIANNLGAAAAKGEYLVFMNSDVFPDRGESAEDLAQYLRAHAEAGLAGCQLLYPDGTIQHCGTSLYYNAAMSIWHCRHPHRGEPADAAEMTAPARTDCVTGACVAMRRTDFEAVGGWACEYLLGGYEDLDLCLKVAASGKQVVYLPRPALTHCESVTFNKIRDEWLKRMAVYNAVLFRAKWDERLRAAKESACGKEHEDE